MASVFSSFLATENTEALLVKERCSRHNSFRELVGSVKSAMKGA
jgi:hypothetical protein